MQSDKLPKMPIGTPFPFRAPEDEESSDLRWTTLYDAQQMQAYALAARKAALEEVRAEMERRYGSFKALKGSYEAGEQSAYGEAECWVEELMEEGE